MMTKSDRIAALVQLGHWLRAGHDEYLDATIKRTAIHNPWFTEPNQQKAIQAIAEQMLVEEKLVAWLSAYPIAEQTDARWIGLVMAGNLPLVGFHDLLCVFAAGHRARVKLSEKDPYLLPAVLRALQRIDPRTEAYFDVTDRLQDFAAIIATGSNNSARYFQAYFGQYPHIIRRNRNAVAVLTGQETAAELHALGRDIFDYFGLGCRNVSKLYLPEGYNFDPLLEALHAYREIILHTKYKNNFDYNYALFLLNKVDFKANGCILLREDGSLQSPIAGLYYEYYREEAELAQELLSREAEIQLVVSSLALPEIKVFGFGEAQQPALDDYADGVDTMAFLEQVV
jgi:hypothetical protein